MNLLTAYNGVLVRVGLYVLIFWPTVGYYVYSDSKKRGVSKPGLWGIVLGFFGVLGLIVYIGIFQHRG